jgi:Domain of unknown function (DUF4331)
MRTSSRPVVRGIASLLTAVMVATGVPVAQAASHREAPLIALDPTADLTDVYAFRSWEDDAKAVFIMNVIPQQVPASGPNFFNLDDEVRYSFNFDLNQNGIAEDLRIDFRFKTEIRNNSSAAGLNFRDIPISYAGVPPITALEGAGSEGLGLRQTYTVSAVANSAAGRRVANALGTRSKAMDGRRLVAVPSNVGPATMPNYPALAAKGVFDLGRGIRVFVGQREETFYIDLGSTFDTLNFRRKPPILTLPQDQNDTQNAFGIDDGFEGMNITTIAIEIPRQLLPSAVGMYASTSRQRIRKLLDDNRSFDAGDFVQVARLANPLVNELLIGTGDKDAWNASDPKDEEQFRQYYETSRLAFLINAVFGTSFPTAGRADISTVLGSYFPPVFTGQPGRFADLLRLNLDIAPTAPANQRRLTVLSSASDPTFGCVSSVSLADPAGFPNGRRPNDDVTDVALRVVAGVLLGPVPCLGDGVNVNRLQPGTPDVNPGNNVSLVFPFLPTPNAGRTPAPNQPLFR